MLRECLAAALLLVLSCTSAEKKCNQDRVAASDAWKAVGDALSGPCRFLDDGEWDQIVQDGREAMASLGAGGFGSRWKVITASCAEGYLPTLAGACKKSARTRVAAAGGAVAARDTSQEAE
jgi:hypothetical protein